MKYSQAITQTSNIAQTSAARGKSANHRPWLFIMLLIFSGLSLTACAAKDKNIVAIADQYGLAYAPIEVMKHEGFLQKRLPDQEIKWVKLANTAAIREAMLSGNLDVGFMGIPPFLIGIDNGMPWRTMTGLSQSPLGLVTNTADVHSLSDLVGKGKIALPQTGSIQHILLSMAAQDQLGDAHIFDSQLIALKHPDGYQALLSNTGVTAHFTAPPYLAQEQSDPALHEILSGTDAFGGDFTFIVGVCQESFYKRKAVYMAFEDALAASFQFMKDEPEKTAGFLAKAYNLDVDSIRQQLQTPGMVFGPEISGVETFINFMAATDFIKNPMNIKETDWTP